MNYRPMAIAACLVAARAQAGETFNIDSVEALKKAVKTLDAGATLVLADGTYSFAQAMRIAGKHGTADAPIVVCAEHPGRAVIDGAGGFELRDCEHIIVRGFVFKHDADREGVKLENCRHARVTGNVFRLAERAKPRHWEHWVTVGGAHSSDNRIDHNRFERKANRGSHVFVRGDDEALLCSQRDRVDHNHFRDVDFADGENGHETIRTGGNDLGASGRSSFTTIEDNLLERCSGEGEIMSLKSSDNLVRNNTLVDCRGAICLRLGNRSTVTGNFVMATGDEPGCGGVKVYGFEHQVFNNYFVGLSGTSHEAPLAMYPGTFDTPTTDKIGKQYDDETTVPATRAWIGHNTWIDCSPLVIGSAKADKERKYTPNQCTFVNNLVVRTQVQKSPLVKVGLVRGLDVHDNLAWLGEAASDATLDGFRFGDPALRRAKDDGRLWLLGDASAAIDVAASGSTVVDRDVFGRVRSGRLDIGAEEFSREPIVHRPLRAADVGPEAAN